MGNDKVLTDSNIVVEIERIVSGRGQIHTVGGKDYSSIKLYDPRTPRQLTRAIALTTLASFVAATKKVIEQEGITPDKLMAHIVNHGRVDLVSAKIDNDDFRQRELFATAQMLQETSGDATSCGGIYIQFGEFQNLETMVIGLQALFAKTPDRDALLKVLGNVTDSNVKGYEDTGVSQVVTARVGVAPKDNVVVPNPVSLAPYRTFVEVEQPVSPFVLRLQKQPIRNDGATPPPLAALFEADGGAWRLTAIANIKKFLEDALPFDVVVLG